MLSLGVLICVFSGIGNLDPKTLLSSCTLCDCTSVCLAWALWLVLQPMNSVTESVLVVVTCVHCVINHYIENSKQPSNYTHSVPVGSRFR